MPHIETATGKEIKCIDLRKLQELHVYFNERGRIINYLLPTGSEEGGVLGAGSIPFSILLSCQDM